jgi:hypothetical protein
MNVLLVSADGQPVRVCFNDVKVAQFVTENPGPAYTVAHITCDAIESVRMARLTATLDDDERRLQLQRARRKTHERLTS